MSNSANDHRKCGRRQQPPKREPSIDASLISFLEARGVFQRGRRPINFRSGKKVLDRKRAA